MIAIRLTTVFLLYTVAGTLSSLDEKNTQPGVEVSEIPLRGVRRLDMYYSLANSDSPCFCPHLPDVAEDVFGEDMDEFNEDENNKIDCETFHTESFIIALLIKIHQIVPKCFLR